MLSKHGCSCAGMGIIETVGQACQISNGDKAECPLLQSRFASHRANDWRETNNCHGDGGNHASGCGGGVMTEGVERMGERQAERQTETVCVWRGGCLCECV